MGRVVLGCDFDCIVGVVAPDGWCWCSVEVARIVVVAGVAVGIALAGGTAGVDTELVVGSGFAAVIADWVVRAVSSAPPVAVSIRSSVRLARQDLHRDLYADLAAADAVDRTAEVEVGRVGQAVSHSDIAGLHPAPMVSQPRHTHHAAVQPARTADFAASHEAMAAKAVLLPTPAATMNAAAAPASHRPPASAAWVAAYPRWASPPAAHAPPSASAAVVAALLHPLPSAETAAQQLSAETAPAAPSQ